MGESEIDDVPVADDIILSLEPNGADISGLLERAEPDDLLAGDHFGPDETLLDVEWMAPAAFTAVEPRRTVQARTSSFPIVKNVSRPRKKGTCRKNLAALGSVIP